MGLDMFLNRRVYVGLLWKGDRNDDKVTKIIIKDKEYSSEDLSYLEYRAITWRKANAIHAWFVKNVQDGNDDCKEYEVTKEQLEELLELCKKDLEYIKSVETIDENMINLKTQGGFFFGSTEYDKYYISDLEYTIKEIEFVLSNNSDNYYTYTSSW